MTRLGSKARPAVLRVQTPERAGEVFDFCTERGWHVIVGVEPDQPEDVTDLRKLDEPEAFTVRREPLPGRNTPCPCGSGAKFKKCCLHSPRVQAQ
jgi:SWIM/SEC-C metal-binding protein